MPDLDARTRLSFAVLRHCVPSGADGLSPLQHAILHDPAQVRICSAPTGAGKSFVFVRAVSEGKRCLFVVPTRRLAQNIAGSAIEDLAAWNPEWPASKAASRVAMWTSDATAQLRTEDPTINVGRHRVRQVRSFGSDVGLIVGTPESVAGLMLRNAGGARGTVGFNLADIGQFDHVVFDEFHSIDPRGFGLAATVSALCAQEGLPTKVTFLSATPIDIRGVLKRTGTDLGKVAILSEEVVTTSAASAPDGRALRALHGGVRFSFEDRDDMVALLEAHMPAMQACIAGGRQVVAVFDSLDALLSQKAALALVMDTLGVPRERRLAINSVDDKRSAMVASDLFVIDAKANPRDYPVLIATSSIEMGVTFKAGFLAMDPGHDALSFVQRAGRVARGDEPGTVVVLVKERHLGFNSWLRSALSMWRMLADASQGQLTVEAFLGTVLKAATARFVDDGEAEADEPPAYFRTMAGRAVWCSALFWHALHEAQWTLGAKRSVSAFAMGKACKIKTWLGEVAAPIVGKESRGADWAKAFLAEAGILRNFAPAVTLVEPGGREQTVPLSLVESRAELAASPVFYDDAGKPRVHIGRRLEEVLASSAKQYVEATREVSMPTDGNLTVPLRSAVEEVLQEFERRLRRETNFGKRKRLTAAKKLAEVSRLVPGANSTPVPSGASAVV